MEIRRNNVIVAFGMKWLLFATERICNCEMMTKHMTCSLKNPWRCPGVLCSNHAQTNYAPFSLSASIRFHLPLWAGVDISGGERETVTSGPPFFRDSTGIPFESFALSFCLAFSSHRPNLFWNDQTQVGHNVKKVGHNVGHNVKSVIMSKKVG